MEINPNIAHITAADNTKYQVLNEAGDDWDEAATRALYEQSNPYPTAPAVTDVPTSGA